MKKKKIGTRAFFIPFMSTLCVLGIIIGMVWVDYYGRKLSFADSTPPVSVIAQSDGSEHLRIHSLGIKKEWDITALANIWEEILKFCCIPSEG